MRTTPDDLATLAWYLQQRPRPFDPQALVHAARAQCTHLPWLPAALAHCTVAHGGSARYTWLVPPAVRRAHRFAGNVLLQLPEGTVVLDLGATPCAPTSCVVLGVEHLHHTLLLAPVHHRA